MTEKSIIFLFQKGVLNCWERDFYFNIRKKRLLTEKQHEKKVEINERIMRYIKNKEQKEQ